MNRRTFLQSFLGFSAGMIVPEAAVALADTYARCVPQATDLVLCRLHLRGAQLRGVIPLGRPTSWAIRDNAIIVVFPSLLWTWDGTDVQTEGMLGTLGPVVRITRGDSLNCSAKVEEPHLEQLISIVDFLRRLK